MEGNAAKITATKAAANTATGTANDEDEVANAAKAKAEMNGVQSQPHKKASTGAAVEAKTGTRLPNAEVAKAAEGVVDVFGQEAATAEWFRKVSEEQSDRVIEEYDRDLACHLHMVDIEEIMACEDEAAAHAKAAKAEADAVQNHADAAVEFPKTRSNDQPFIRVGTAAQEDALYHSVKIAINIAVQLRSSSQARQNKIRLLRWFKSIPGEDKNQVLKTVRAYHRTLASLRRDAIINSKSISLWHLNKEGRRQRRRLQVRALRRKAKAAEAKAVEAKATMAKPTVAKPKKHRRQRHRLARAVRRKAKADEANAVEANAVEANKAIEAKAIEAKAVEARVLGAIKAVQTKATRKKTPSEEAHVRIIRPSRSGGSGHADEESGERAWDAVRVQLTKARLSDVECGGQGACQFKALAHQLFEDASRHEQVRLRVIQELVGNKRQYRRRCGHPVSLEAYIEEMMPNDAQGDDTTLQAAACAYSTGIRVIDTTENIMIYRPRNVTDPRREVTICYLPELHYRGTATSMANTEPGDTASTSCVVDSELRNSNESEVPRYQRELARTELVDAGTSNRSVADQSQHVKRLEAELTETLWPSASGRSILLYQVLVRKVKRLLQRHNDELGIDLSTGPTIAQYEHMMTFLAVSREYRNRKNKRLLLARATLLYMARALPLHIFPAMQMTRFKIDPTRTDDVSEMLRVDEVRKAYGRRATVKVGSLATRTSEGHEIGNGAFGNDACNAKVRWSREAVHLSMDTQLSDVRINRTTFRLILLTYIRATLQVRNATTSSPYTRCPANLQFIYIGCGIVAISSI